MKVNTSKLKSMLSRVNSCKPSNLLEITNYYELEFKEDGLYLHATDGTNYITVFDSDSKSKQETSIIVKADQFSKLINKTTTDKVDLTVKGSYLEVKGNGVYKVEMVQDEIYPKFYMEESQLYDISLQDLKEAINGGKYAKSNVVNDGVLFGYLIRNNAVTTADAIKVYTREVEGNVEGLNILLTPQLANIVLALDAEKLKIAINEDNTLIKFIGQTVTVGGAIMEGVEDYPDLTEMFNTPYPYTAKVDTKLVLESIDRLDLFVTLYDKGVINLVFTNNSLTISTSSKSVETIPYMEPINNEVAFMTSVRSKYLQDLFNACTEAEVSIDFGFEDIIRLNTPTISMLLATADEE